MNLSSIEAGAQARTRWLLGHGVPNVAMTRRGKRGDLQSLTFTTTKDTSALQLDLYDKVRAHGPFYRGKFADVTTRHAVAKAVLGSPDLRVALPAKSPAGPLGKVVDWSNKSRPLGPLVPPSLLATDPPDHTRMRKLVTRVFSAKAVAKLQGRTEEIANQLIDDLSASTSNEVEIIESFASLLPVTVISEILGVPADEHSTVRRFGTEAAPSLDLGVSASLFLSTEETLRRFDTWLQAHVRLVRESPGDDLLSQLVLARDEGGGALNDAELIATAGLVLAAGFETTVNLLGNGIALLDQHRDQREALLAGEADWLNAADEILRYDSPVLMTGRAVDRPTEIFGQQLREDRLIMVVLAAANRDPEVFADPNRFDVFRANAHDHLAFSSGRHYCLGASLARMEGAVGLRTLHERFPDLSVVPGGRRRTTRMIRGYAQLPVKLKG